MKKISKSTYIVFGIYLLLLCWIILLKTEINISQISHFRNINLIPFGSSAIVNGKLCLSEIIQNVLLFIPFGIYITIIKSDWKLWKKLLLAFGLSLAFEITQFIFAIGGSDITDLINNTLGAFIGIGIYNIFKKILKDKSIKIINILGLIGEIGFIALFILLIMG